MFRVLIVDDMEISRIELKRLALWGEGTGFAIPEEAADGREALRKLEMQPADLVITDIKMPGMDGVELLKRIMEKQLASCIVFLSEYSEFEYAREGMVNGAFDYLIKPVEPHRLELLLHRAAKHIGETVLEKEKLKKLEESLLEKMDVFFPAAEVKGLGRLLKEGDASAAEMAGHLVETLWVVAQEDRIKVAYVLNRVLVELAGELQRQYLWLPMFANMGSYPEMDFSGYTCLAAMKTGFSEVIGELARLVGRFMPDSHTHSMIRQVCRVVLENVESDMTIKQMADTLFLNNSYLSTLFREKTGTALGEYITKVKMERAKILLRIPDIRNYEIAGKLGFKDVEYFSRVFKKHAGISPSDFRQRNK